MGYAEGLDASRLKSREEILIRIAAANPAVLLIDKYLAHGMKVTSSFIIEIQQRVPNCLIVIFTADDSAIATSDFKVIHKPLLYTRTEMSTVLAKLSGLFSANTVVKLGESRPELLSASQWAPKINRNVLDESISYNDSMQGGLEPRNAVRLLRLLQWLSPKNKILIVEDDLADKHYCSLERIGITSDLFVIAESLQEAFLILRRGDIGLIVTDLDFPMSRSGEIVRLNGRYVIQAAEKAGIPIVLSTSREPDDLDPDYRHISHVSKGNWDERDIEVIYKIIDNSFPKDCT
jgi:hypothetical protein